MRKENVSTPREIMVFLKEAIKIEEIREIMSTKESTIVGHRDNRTRSVEIRNTDRLLSKDLATILGGKTGYTDIARYCLAIAAETDGKRQLGMVFLGAEGKHTRFADFTRVINWLLPSKAFAGETKTAPGSSPATNQEKSLPASGTAIIKQPDTPVGNSALKDGGASAKPEDLFEYYW